MSAAQAADGANMDFDLKRKPDNSRLLCGGTRGWLCFDF